MRSSDSVLGFEVWRRQKREHQQMAGLEVLGDSWGDLLCWNPGRMDTDRFQEAPTAQLCSLDSILGSRSTVQEEVTMTQPVPEARGGTSNILFTYLYII